MPTIPPKTNPGAQNMKMGPDALDTAENMTGSEKHEHGKERPRYRRKWDPTPTVPPKMSPGAQHIVTGPDALGTAENESGCAKNENGTRRRRYRRK
jgi:hypothetical protein